MTDIPRTPCPQAALIQYDHLAAADAVAAAWTRPGTAGSSWHLMCQRNVRRLMPVLARAVERLAHDRLQAPDPQWRDTVVARARGALGPGVALSAVTVHQILRDLIDLIEREGPVSRSDLPGEIVSAACGWHGAIRGQQLYPGERADLIEAEQRQRLVDAVDAYLAPDSP